MCTVFQRPSGISDLMTDTCQALGSCWYFRSKFVSSCQDVQCHSLTIKMNIEQVANPEAGTMAAKMSFFAPGQSDFKTIPVPEGAPCKYQNKEGLCRNSQCEVLKSDDAKYDEYQKFLKLKPVNGSWATSDDWSECIKVPAENNYFSSAI